jgi:hypothetical protein
MNKNPLNKKDRDLVTRLQTQLDSLRKQLKISERGQILYRFDASYCDEEIILVEADGFGGAVLRVVEGNYPTDFLTREEQVFQTENEAVKAAELFRQSVAA